MTKAKITPTVENEAKTNLKSGMITMIGRSNAGKSTLLNTLIGTKIAAVTHKPQTTRHIIHGVLNAAEGQAVFVDTPGILKGGGSPLAGKLEARVHEALQDIDLIIHVVDPSKALGAEERFLMSLARKIDKPKILVINKVDLHPKERPYQEDYLALAENYDAVMELSALHNRHVQPLIKKVFELLPTGEPMYPPDQFTNIDPKFWLAEIIREKILLALRDEVPYSVNVEVTEVEDKEDVTVIKATIFTNDSRYKKMIIGAHGRSIKEIGIAARKELATALNRKVYLELEVETDKHWDERV